MLDCPRRAVRHARLGSITLCRIYRQWGKRAKARARQRASKQARAYQIADGIATIYVCISLRFASLYYYDYKSNSVIPLFSLSPTWRITQSSLDKVVSMQLVRVKGLMR
jgi:hypothetical protein